MLYLIVGAAVALAVYAYFTDSGDQYDPPPSHSRPYEPPQPPAPRRRDERQNRQHEAIVPPRKVEALVKVEAPVKVEATDPASLRIKANREGDLMSLYYQQSKEAYERRDHASCQALKEQGKSHEITMKNLHAKASASIYQENNRDKSACEVDLHGLYVKEAIAYSEKAIREARQRGDSEIRLIVGKGSHSDGGVSKLKPAIQEYMRKDRIPVEVDLKNPGVLIVRVNGR